MSYICQVKSVARGSLARGTTLVLAAAIAAALTIGACGSGQSGDPGQSTEPDRGTGSDQAPGPPSAGPTAGGEVGRAPRAAKAGEPSGSADSASGGKASAKPASSAAGRHPNESQAAGAGALAGIDRSAGSCPRSLTREQCIANAEASAPDTPSHPVAEPEDCLAAMSRADCEAMIGTEQAAQRNSGHSFSPDECLRYYTREECEAVLEAMGQSPK